MRLESNTYEGRCIRFRVRGADRAAGAVAFAAGFRTLKAAVIGFSKIGNLTPPEVQVGDFAVSPLMWKAHPDLEPENAATDLIEQMTSWLSGHSVGADANTTRL